MTQRKKYRLWIVGVSILALCSFLMGTTLTCFQKSGGILAGAEDCCQSHCQHVMVGDMAAKCCQSHQTKVAQALPVAPTAKAIVVFAVSTVHSSLILPGILQGPDQLWARLSIAERSPPSPPFYTLHCTLLI